MSAPIDLHLVTWNRPEMTKLVIKTIRRNTKPGTYNLHVFDNGSGKPMQNMLRDLDYSGQIDRLTVLKTNHGLEAARQQLLQFNTFGDLFVCIDNDCLPQPILRGLDWLERLVLLMNKYNDFAAIAARTQVMIGTGNIFEEADKVGDDIVEFPHPGGSYRIMRTEAINRVGGWDDPKIGRGAEERYIGAKLNAEGFRTAFAVKVECLHLFGPRGENGTDRWGYDKDMKPEDSGHSDVSHPALTNGDDLAEVARYAGEELTNDYCSN